MAIILQGASYIKQRARLEGEHQLAAAMLAQANTMMVEANERLLQRQVDIKALDIKLQEMKIELLGIQHRFGIKVLKKTRNRKMRIVLHFVKCFLLNASSFIKCSV